MEIAVNGGSAHQDQARLMMGGHLPEGAYPAEAAAWAATASIIMNLDDFITRE